MANVLANAAAWLHTQRQANMAADVTYTRLGGSSVALKATIGRTDAELLAESELVSSAGIRDFIFRTADFISAGEFIPPGRLDLIEESDGAKWQVVELSGEPVWRFSDEYRNAIRVHVSQLEYLAPVTPGGGVGSMVVGSTFTVA